MLVKKQRRLLEIRVKMSRSRRLVDSTYRLLSQQAAALTFAYHEYKLCPAVRRSCNCWKSVKIIQAVNKYREMNRCTDLTVEYDDLMDDLLCVEWID